MPGEILGRTSLSKTQLRDAYRQAGGFLRALHELPHPDDDPLLLPEACRQRARSWVERSVGIIERATRDWVLRQVDEAAAGLDALKVRRLPCHHDYAECNWLDARAGERVTLSVIDFKYARPDYWLSDLKKLYLDGWNEELEGAFWQGYSKRPTVDEWALLDKLGALSAFTTIVWVREHHDDTFTAKG